MTLTITEEGTIDMPVSLYGTGTPKRRRIVYLRGTSTATSDTWSVGTAEPDAADVEGILWCSINSAGIAAGSAYPTWSSTTVTLSTAAGTWELGVLVNLN